MTKEELTKVLADHKEWALDSSKGKRADLRGANLSEANLSKSYLSGAYLSRAKGIIRVDHSEYTLLIQLTNTQIGCEYRSNKEWLAMKKSTAIKLGISGAFF